MKTILFSISTSVFLLCLLAGCSEEPRIGDDLKLPEVSTSQAAAITVSSAKSGGEITDDGGYAVTKRGVCYGTIPEPTLKDNVLYSGEGKGKFECLLENLTQGTTYYLRAFATNELGTQYGNAVNFMTKKIGVPTVITLTVIAVTANSARSGGSVSNDGGSAVTRAGLCYIKGNGTPTVSNNTVDSENKSYFDVSLSGLEPNTNYSCRAFAVNSAGTGYGEIRTFTTKEEEKLEDIVKLIEVKQTSYEYSASGFLNNGAYYNYKYYWTIQVYLSDYRKVSEFGFELNGTQRFYFFDISNGLHSESLVTHSNSSSVSISCKAYAVLLDGTYVYGEEKILNLSATTQSSAPSSQNIKADSSVSNINTSVPNRLPSSKLKN